MLVGELHKHKHDDSGIGSTTQLVSETLVLIPSMSFATDCGLHPHQETLAGVIGRCQLGAPTQTAGRTGEDGHPLAGTGIYREAQSQKTQTSTLATPAAVGSTTSSVVGGRRNRAGPHSTRPW
eukprot:SAG31_NODE_22487_length_524_cov_1.303529_1_plen_123_part_00